MLIFHKLLVFMFQTWGEIISHKYNNMDELEIKNTFCLLEGLQLSQAMW